MLAKLTVIDPNFWPSIIYGWWLWWAGSSTLHCEHFCSLLFGSIRDTYCDYKDMREADNSRTETMLNCINTITFSTAECEHGFSAMNLIATDLRSVLLQIVITMSCFGLDATDLRYHSVWSAEKCIDFWLLRPTRVYPYGGTDKRTVWGTFWVFLLDCWLI